MVPVLSLFLLVAVGVRSQCVSQVCRSINQCQASEYSSGQVCNRFMQFCCQRQCAVSNSTTCGTSAGCFTKVTSTVTTPATQRTATCAGGTFDTTTPCSTGCADCVEIVAFWSVCGVTCGNGGIQTRTRSVTTPAVGMGKCATTSGTETRPCDPPPPACPGPTLPLAVPTPPPPSTPPPSASATPAATTAAPSASSTRPAAAPNPSAVSFSFGSAVAMQASFALSSDVTARAVSVDDPAAMAVLTFAPSLNSVGVQGAAAAIAGEIRFPFALQLQFAARFTLQSLTLASFDPSTDRAQLACFNRNERRRAEPLLVDVTSATAELASQTAAGFDTFEVRCNDRVSSFGVRGFTAAPKSAAATDTEGGSSLGDVGIALIVVGVIICLAAVALVAFVVQRRRKVAAADLSTREPAPPPAQEPARNGIYAGASLTLAERQQQEQLGVYAPMTLSASDPAVTQYTATVGQYGPASSIVGSYHSAGSETATEQPQMYLKW